MSDETRTATGVTGVPTPAEVAVVGWTQGDRVIPFQDLIKAEHINELRAVAESLIKHTHAFSNEYSVPSQPDPVVIDLSGGGVASSVITDQMGPWGWSAVSGGKFCWGQASNDKPTVLFASAFSGTPTVICTAGNNVTSDDNHILPATVTSSEVTFNEFATDEAVNYIAYGS